MTPSRAMVLAAGLGERMRPLTAVRPKPVLPVLNRPLIAHVLDHLASHGVTFAVVNSHHLPGELERLVRQWAPPSLQVTFSPESELLGTAGGLGRAARHFRQERFYLVNSDSLTDADLAAAAEAHERSGRWATMVVMAHDPASGYRPVMIDADGAAPRVAGIAGRTWAPETAGRTLPATFIGTHILEPGVLDLIAPDRPSDINADVYPRLLDREPGAVGAWLHRGWWFEAGSPGRYLDLNLRMLERADRVAVVGPGFFIDDEARVERSVLGSGARLERGVIVRDSVLWDDVRVGEGCQLNRCIVTDGVTLPPFAAWSSSVLMPAADGAVAVESLAGAA